MKKTPTIFLRDKNDRSRVTDECNSECLWVFRGEGVATRKYDGACCAILDGIFYKRREVKPGKDDPDGFRLVQEDPITGKRVGWVMVGNGSEDSYFREAIYNYGIQPPDGTYELIGPKVQGNPERLDMHRLLRHADAAQYDDAPTSRAELVEWLRPLDIEGLVWHHPDGKMAKIKKRDLGLPRMEEER